MLSKKTTQRLAGMLVVAMIGVFAMPAFAAAQQVNPTNEEYDPALTQISQGATPPSPPAQPSGLSDNVGPLPFTGFDVIAMAAVALAVTGLGLALQRAVSRQPSDGPR